MCVCVRVGLGHFAVQQKLTEQCKSTIIEKIKNNSTAKKPITQLKKWVKDLNRHFSK